MPLLQRPDVLDGTTYQIRTPHAEHSFFLTITHLEVDGRPRPFEIFLNSRNMENFEWVAALTRLVSAVMRREENSVFLVSELQAIFDARGAISNPAANA